MTAPVIWSPRDRALLALLRVTRLGRGPLRRAALKWLRGRVGDAALDVRVRGLRAELALDNTTDRKTLLAPHRHNAPEIDFLAAGMPPQGGVFVDVGANSGLVSLGVLAQRPSARVVAIEPNSVIAARARRNLVELNPVFAAQVTVVEMAVGANAETLGLRTDLGFGRASLTRHPGLPVIDVRVQPLATILREMGVGGVDAMKIDIEGWEDTAIPPYLAEMPPGDLPRVLVMERQKPDRRAALDALAAAGFAEIGKTRNNLLFKRIDT